MPLPLPAVEGERVAFAQYVDEVKQLSAALFFQDLLRPAIEMHFGRPARS